MKKPMKRPLSPRNATAKFPGFELAYKEAADHALLNAALTLDEGDVRKAKTLCLRAVTYMNRILEGMRPVGEETAPV